MFSAKPLSSTRAALASLRVVIPPAPKLDNVIASIRNKESDIRLSSMLLSPEDMNRLITAFASLPEKSSITLWVSQLFTNPRSEQPDNLMNFWNTVKYKVTKVIWEQNRFYKSFLSQLAQECKQDQNVARCEFQLCDQTDSVTSPESPLSAVGTPKSAEGSVYQSGLPLFAAGAVAVRQERDELDESNVSLMGYGQ